MMSDLEQQYQKMNIEELESLLENAVLTEEAEYLCKLTINKKSRRLKYSLNKTKDTSNKKLFHPIYIIELVIWILLTGFIAFQKMRYGVDTKQLFDLWGILMVAGYGGYWGGQYMISDDFFRVLGQLFALPFFLLGDSVRFLAYQFYSGSQPVKFMIFKDR